MINFATPEPPTATHGSVNIDGGQFGYFAANANIGGSTRGQKVGWFTNFLQKRGDGWRDFWFDITDAQGKLTFKPNETHTIGLKFGFYDEESNSTYLGLTGPQWEGDPGANSVPHDLLVVRRYSGSLVHTAALSPDVVWSNTFYAYNTLRNWSRQDFDRADLGRPYLGVNGDPSIPGGAVFLRNSTGNNNRQFSVAGAQTALSLFHNLGAWKAKLDAGLRYLHESASDTRIDGDTFNARTGVLRDGENRYGNAGSGFVQERIYFGDRVILTPGFRFEYYDYQRDIYRRGFEDVDRFARHRVREAIPGLGVSVKAHEMFTLFAGVHRGFSPPRTKDAITSNGVPLDLDAELSWNYEAGLRFQRPRIVSGEVVFFRLDFENQIIPGAQSGGAATTLVNAGETLHQGLEASVRMHWNEIAPVPWLVYTDFRYMYLPTAKFVRNALYGGNRLPYASENTFSVLLGVRQRQGFGMQVDASYIGRLYGDNANLEQPTDDGTAGPLPSYIMSNAMVDYTIRRERFEVTPYFTVKNLADSRYIASRAPQGIQPGFLRQAIAGLRLTF